MGYPNVNMTITINEVNCWDTEDITGDDEVKLKLEIPPESGTSWQNKTYKKKMGDKSNFHHNKQWKLNKTFRYNPSNSKGIGCYPHIKLIDEDWPDPDDLLGETYIDIVTSGQHTIVYKTNTYHYTILYTLVANSY